MNSTEWKTKPSFLSTHRRGTLTAILVGAFLLSLFSVEWGEGVLHRGGAQTLKNMFGALLRPDLSPDLLRLALYACWQTLAYSVISISVAVVLAFFLAIFASGVVVRSPWIRRVARALIGFLRSVHELIWAWLFVAAIGLNPLGAIFALAIPYAGYLAKIYADVIEEVPAAAISSLQLAGAGKLQTFFYGYLPSAFPNMLSYTMYRLECAIRSTSVLSFVGLGGIGFQIQLSLQDLRYDQVWTFIAFLVFLILIIDRWGQEIRKRVAHD